MKINDSNYVDLVVGHLNTPYGPVVSNSDLLDALRAGSLSVVQDEASRAILSSLFIECTGAMIGSLCAREGIDLQKAHDLYKEIVASGEQPRVFAWEDAVKEILE